MSRHHRNMIAKEADEKARKKAVRAMTPKQRRKALRALISAEWRRCGNPSCGALFKAPGKTEGKACRKCGCPLSISREV